MNQELMLVESLPISEKEIQIPSKELNAVQKSQYLKNIEGTRDEIVRKIDVCKEYKKSEFMKIEKTRLVEKINGNEIGAIIKELNSEIESYNRIISGNLKDRVSSIESLKTKLKNLTSKNKDFSEPSIDLPNLEKINILNANSCISDYSFESGVNDAFERKQGNLFETKKKVLQTHFKLMQDALLYYKVDRFKQLLLRFFKLRDEVNKIYVPIIKSQEVAGDE